MKQWTKEIEVHASIEQVWKLLNGSLENMQKIMPQVVDHKPVKVTDENVGSIYRQKFKEGKRIVEYDVETLEYADHSDHKKLKVGFTLASLFEITASYELIPIDHNTTLFRYTATNRPLKWFANLFLFFAREKTVVEFVERVKGVAESEKH